MKIDKIIQELFKQRKKNNLNVVDFFSGCGGLSLAFKQAGYNPLLAIDNDKDSLETIKANNCSKVTLNLDLFKSTWIHEVKKNIDISEVDVVVAGPPCQGFSLTGPRNLDDKRNKLYKSVYDFIELSRPKAFLIENVKGMATLYQGQVMKSIVGDFTSLGYKVSTKVLNAKDYGVPQSRERLFYVGMKNIDFKFPKPLFNNSNYITCRDALSDLPSLNVLDEVGIYKLNPMTLYQKLIRGNNNNILNHDPTKHSDLVVSVIKQVPEGGNHKDLPKGVGTSRKFNEAWTRYHGNKPSRTIDTGHRNHFHYEYDRVPTVRENCRLQSFPDSYTIIGSKTSQNRQVGNAVPVLLGKVLAEEIYEQIKDN